jgi:acetolactate synthase-1/2/3 large subunit
MELAEKYGFPSKGIFLWGDCAAAQWAHRICLRKPEHFAALHIHMPGSFDTPVPEAANVWWSLSVGEHYGGFENSMKWYEEAKNRAGQDPISPDYLFYCLNQLIDDDTIFVNHTLGHCASVTEQIVRTKPGTWFGCPSGMIGWATGAALGAASAATGKMVVTAMTDGGFVWGCPTSTFWTAANYRFPFLALICNNNGYGAIRDIHPEFLREDPPSEGYIAETATNFQPDYAMIAWGAGAYGRTVKKAEDVLPALKEAWEAVRSGKPAVLDVYIPEKR